MAVKRSCVLCTYKEEPAYRLFPSENSEALPNTTMPSSVDFSKIGKMFLKSFTRSANRVAQKMENLFILAYVGTLNKVETYLIASETGSLKLLVYI
jgi:hypothetical protein